MKPTRVLVVTESLSVWGAERTLIELAKNVDRETVALTFLVARESPFARVLEEMGFPVILHRFAAHPALVKYGSLGSANLPTLLHEVFASVIGGIRLSRYARKFDALLSFSIWQSIETLIAARVGGAKFVLDVHETFSGSKGHTVTRALAKMSDLVIAPSESVLMRSGIVIGSKVVVIPRPVGHPAVMARSSAVVLPLTLGVFGQIAPHKGIAQLVSAVASIETGTVRLLVVGGRQHDSQSEYEQEVRAAAAVVGSNTEVIDAVPSVFELMNLCDFVVNASDHEAFGRGVVEGIASGSTPVAIGEAGPSEIIRATGIGVILESLADVAPFLEAVKDGSETVTQVGLDERVEALLRYDATVISHQYFELVRGLMRVQG